MEHFFKGLMNPESQISAIPPERYGDRFVKFINGVTKTREAADREKREEAANAANDPQLSGLNITHQERESSGMVMEKAEAQAERSSQRGASEEDIPDRSMHILRSPSAERGELGTALPVVEEAIESSSTGGRSGRSTESSFHPQASRPANSQEDRAFESISRDEPPHRPPPPKDARYSTRHSGPPTPPQEEKGRGRDKQLPMPPPLETYVHVN
jgi:1-phosphatidylinositol-4-phosphate 5-kinase